MATLSISIVTYRPDIILLTRCLQSLNDASDHAMLAGHLTGVEVIIIDNSTDNKIQEELRKIAGNEWSGSQKKQLRILTTETNLGYGKAHNLAITKTTTDYHLVLNPDVILEKESLAAALNFMVLQQNVAMLTPSIVNDSGQKEYLNKRHPDVLTLFIRGFAPASLKEVFRRKIAHYEMRDRDPCMVDFDIPLASGCFMLFRTQVLKQLGGFSDKFFLYFEDYDLSIRTHEHGEIAYVPSVKIQHFGGGAARKGFRHVFLFIRSSITFFNMHGWRFW